MVSDFLFYLLFICFDLFATNFTNLRAVKDVMKQCFFSYFIFV